MSDLKGVTPIVRPGETAPDRRAAAPASNPVQGLSEAQLEKIIRGVLSQISGAPAVTQPAAPIAGGSLGDGVFERVEDAIEAAWEAQKVWQKTKIAERNKVIAAIRRCATEHTEEWCRKIVAETRMGRYEDKLLKHKAVIEKTPGPECLTTEAISGDEGLMIEEYAPFGVIASITPTTNPTETIINNTISMISGGNSVVFNVHPRAKRVSADCLQALNRAMVAAGAPANLITMTKEPTMDNVDKLAASPKIRLMAGTGGMGMVNALLRSGKKCIGAGAGNPPVIVDETADIRLAAEKIYDGASFDNNILCWAEKEAFVVDRVYGEFLRQIQNQGAVLISPAQTAELLDIVFKRKPNGDYEINRDWVGQDASKILGAIGITGKDSCRLVVCETNADHPFVQVEQLMPILPIVRCGSFEEAMREAVRAEHGNRHTASIFTQDVTRMTEFGRAIETTIFVKNSYTRAGAGVGGEGHVTVTIAGPTGEGITCAKTFCRRRRCMLGEGGLRII